MAEKQSRFPEGLNLFDSLRTVDELITQMSFQFTKGMINFDKLNNQQLAGVLDGDDRKSYNNAIANKDNAAKFLRVLKNLRIELVDEIEGAKLGAELKAYEQSKKARTE